MGESTTLLFDWRSAGVLAALAVFAVLVLIALLALLRRMRDAEALPYIACESLMNPGERAFLAVLDRVTPPHLRLMGKVRLADVITVRRGTDKWAAWFGRISQKHVDFVLCDRRTLAPVLVVELDGQTHERRDRIERDRFVDRALRSAGIPVLHVPAQGTYDASQLGRLISQVASCEG